MPSGPLVSVVLPSYNHARFIGEAIRSVIQQEYRPLELIVIDDGSVDRSCEIIRSFASAARRSGVGFYFRTRENLGAHHTINEALSIAQGEWLTILNSDDYYLPGRISKLLKEAQKRRSQLVFSEVIHVDDRGDLIADDHPFRAWYVRQAKKAYPSTGFRLLEHNVAVTTGNFFFSRRLFEQVGSFRNYRLLHDYDFILRSLFFTEPAYLPEKLLAYRVHGENTIDRFDHLNAEEGPRLAADLALRALLEEEPLNPMAPWAPRFAKQFEEFWSASAGGCIKSWLGGENLSSFYRVPKASSRGQSRQVRV